MLLENLLNTVPYFLLLYLFPRLVPDRMVPFSFPLSKYALWDPVPMGDAIGSHIAYYR